MKAFPNPHRTDELGMTLRDYFAAKAMQAVITGYATQNKVDSYSDYWAGFAYEMADAMLKAKEEA